MAAELILFALLFQGESTSIPLRELLAVEALGERSRSAVYTDALQARLARGEWAAPAEGEKVASATGEMRRWARFESDGNGWFSGPAFSKGWAWTTLAVPEGGAWRLDASGHADVLVDGEPHAGDVYGLGLTRVPLALEAGSHEFLFRCGRGRLRATLEKAPAPVYLEEKDRTLPDVIRGEHEPLLLGTIVANATADRARGYTLRARVGDRQSNAPVPDLLPSSFRKCVLALDAPVEPTADVLEVELELLSPSGDVAHAATLQLNVRDPEQTHTRTFVSQIDGSVQYYAVTPPTGRSEERPALLLSLHGAGVEGRGQAACYEPKDWAVVVAPTNRRAFGFDWEDWGRLDALEVLELAQRRFATDPMRTVLTGHSMGGHGTWQLGAHFPARFAAIAPSAGWLDFWSYAGASAFEESDPIGPLLDRAANASRTQNLITNYGALGVYVLHGDADDNVPVSQARLMRDALGAFHPNFAYYERPGAGHWWGNACVDWPPLVEFLERSRLPAPDTVLDIDFTTADPSVSSRCHWLAIEMQGIWLEPSRVRAHLNVAERVLDLELDNVSRMLIDLSPFAEAFVTNAKARAASAEAEGGDGRSTVEVRVGSTRFEADTGGPVTLARGPEGMWQVAGPLGPWYKSPRRGGPFKGAFRNRFLFVYGTGGTEEENAWALAKARYDHEQWRYRGNGAVDVLADVDFEAADHPDRDVILYGNQDTNGAWASVLGTEAFQLRRGHVRVGDETVEGADLALLAMYPRQGSDVASVAVVGGTGLVGARATDFLPYFVSGVGYPDWTVFGTEFLTRGLAGVRGAGYFRTDWSPQLGAITSWR